MKILGLDIGTTSCKCAVFNKSGMISKVFSSEYETVRKLDNQYIDIQGLVSGVKLILSEATKEFDINAICISSLGEAFVPVGKNGEILGDAILYTDSKGQAEANKISDSISENEFIQIAGSKIHTMYSLPKMMWRKDNEPEFYAKTEKLLLICDFIGYILTGKAVIDYSLAARTLALDIRKKEWSDKILNAAGIEKTKLSEPKAIGSFVGFVTEKASKEFYLSKDCRVILGGHDQIIAALGSGSLKAGSAIDGTGTVECITPVFDGSIDVREIAQNGYACLPYALDNTYVIYMFNYCGGALLKWFRDNLKYESKELLENCDDNFYDVFNKRIKDTPTELFILPHFAGAATPYMDNNAKGAIINLTLDTSDTDIYKALMEGATYEMRVNIELADSLGIKIDKLVATGGGAASKEWLKIKADILNVPIYPLKNTEAGITGAAMVALTALGEFKNLQEASDQLLEFDEPVYPNAERAQKYDELFKKYKKIYNLVKELR